MQAPKLSDDNSVLASQRRASEQITQGIETEIDELHLLTTSRRWLEVSLFVFIYVVGALLVHILHESASLLCLAGITCMGIALNSLGILIHDGLHGLLARNPSVNHLCSFLCGLPLGISATAYQVTHNNHHYELGRRLDYGTYRQHFRTPTLIWTAYFLQLFFGTILYVALIPFLAFAVASRKSRVFIVIEYASIAGIFFLVYQYASLESILLYWAYPLVVMSLLTNVRGLGSHALGDVENIYLSSRTIKGSWLIDILFLHENYHLEHHLFPRVPSYNLPKVHKLIWNRLPEALYAKSYLQFLLGFFQAAMRNDLKPLGAITPAKKGLPNEV